MRILLIDGDILCRRAAHGAASAVRDPAAEEKEAAARLDATIARLKARLRGDRLVAALGAGASFRATLSPAYKAARRGRPAPASLGAVRRRLAETVETRAAPGFEADDLLGVWATAPDLSFAAEAPAKEGRRPTGPRIVVSADKDLLSVPGLHGAESGRVWRVSPAEAETRHLAQTLIGDSADGYRGCPGIGPRRAEALLARAARDPWAAVTAAFAGAGLGPDAALREARLARILRHGEVDPDAMAPILWTPARLRGGGGPETVRRALAPFVGRRPADRGGPRRAGGGCGFRP